MILAPKPPLLDALPPGHAVLEASAGTGKTYALEHLVIDLVLSQGFKLEEILVVTFTEKAALELRTRVRALLEHLQQQESTPPEIDPASAWILDETAKTRLDTALQAFDAAPIHTIHGFCLRVLQESAFDCGRLFRQEQASGSVLFERAFKDVLRTRFTVEAGDAALLSQALAAGKGVDDIRILLERASREQAVLEPDEAVALAALQRVDTATLDDLEGMAAALKAAGVTTQSINAIRKVLPELSTVLAQWKTHGDIGAFWAAFGDFRDRLEKQAHRFLDSQLGPDLNQLGAHFERLLRHAPSLEARLVQRFLPFVQERLRVLKREEGLFDFNDMIEGVREALGSLKGRLRQRYKLALVDEFQDTDAAQWEIFRTLFLEGPQRLVLVGDPKQAIYGFRGGDLPTYLRATREVLAENFPVILDRNFRSTPALIRIVNRILDRDFFNGANAYEHPVQCGRPELRLEDSSGNELPAIRVLVTEELDSVPRVLGRLANALAEEIRVFIGSHPRLDGRTLDYGDVFILTATIREGLVAAGALREAGVPFAFFKQEGLFQTPEAGWILDLLRAVEEPRDSARRARALLTPFFGVPLEDLEGALELPEEHPVMLRLQSWSALARSRRWAELFRRVLDESGILRRMLLLHDGEREFTNLQHLFEILLETALARHRGFQSLVRQLGRWVEEKELPEGEDGNLQRMEGSRNAVQILTMHKSKGLEAPVVALLGGISESRSSGLNRFTEHGERRVFIGKPPATVKALVDREAEEEDQRLLYVALTRAKARLILPCGRAGNGPVGRSFEKETGDPKGRIRILNRRLRALLDEADPDIETVTVQPEAQIKAGAVDTVWVPGPAVLPPEPDYEGLRFDARAVGVTSFTGLQHRMESEDPEPGYQGVILPAGALPAGARTGVLLHGLLEKVELASLRDRDAATWLALSETNVLLEEELRYAALPASWAPRAGALVHRALTTALPQVALRELDPARVLRELRFLSPFPGAPDFLTGSLDVLFEHQGRAFVLDWKSNALPDYGPQALEDCVREHYDLQVRIYTLAALDFLGIEDELAYETRFGGALYVFLRGLPGQGVWSRRPSWVEVEVWRQELAALKPFEVHRG